ncbi:MAG: glycosyltransferase [Candidatus Omnitrophica bacterium]|nr:glycosyltransferase [Candidatus Omnitrophota bacterium]
MTEALVSVIVPTCGIRDHYIPCLNALSRQTHQPLEMIVVNNALDPALTRKVKEICPSATVHVPPQNLYYGPAINKGIESSRAEYLLCLNDDVFLKKDFIEKALRGFFADEHVGAVTGKLLRPDQKTVDSTGIFMNPWYGVHERGYGQTDRGQFDKPGFVFGSGGAAAFYRRRMLDELREKGGWFDARFKMFFEDLDLAWRAQKRGWKTRYVPEAVAYHVRGGSARVRGGEGKKRPWRFLSDELLVNLIKNRYRMILKNETALCFLPRLLPVLLYEIYTAAYLLFCRPRVLPKFLEG